MLFGACARLVSGFFFNSCLSCIGVLVCIGLYLEPHQWRNREDWRLVSGRRRQLFKKTGQVGKVGKVGR